MYLGITCIMDILLAGLRRVARIDPILYTIAFSNEI